jgi:hypothetical protein
MKSLFDISGKGLSSITHQLSQDEGTDDEGTKAQQHPGNEPVGGVEKEGVGPLLALKKGKKAKIKAFHENRHTHQGQNKSPDAPPRPRGAVAKKVASVEDARERCEHVLSEKQAVQFNLRQKDSTYVLSLSTKFCLFRPGVILQ